jgi:CRP/FNR family cyclic AMP-dependent transcriptional regulator
MNQTTIEEVLLRSKVFEGMEPEYLRRITASAQRVHFDAGQLILKQGQPADRFYFIENGKVSLIAEEDGEPSRFSILGKNEALGWSWLFPPHKWYFSARAVVPTDAILIDGQTIRHECETNHDLGYEVMKRFSAVMLHRLQSSRAELVQARREILRLSEAAADKRGDE